MKEQIYTIPVTDAFREDSECPLCILEKKLEEQYLEYFLGPTLMEPDHRIETNKKGFCRKHFELLYNRQENRLGLGLIIDTHLQHQNSKLEKLFGRKFSAKADKESDDEHVNHEGHVEHEEQVKYEERAEHVERVEYKEHKEAASSFIKNITFILKPKRTNSDNFIETIIEHLKSLEKQCVICEKMDYTMGRYMDVIFYLWSKESDFRDLFNKKKGFCLVHFRQLLEGAVKYLNSNNRQVFIESLLKMQLENMERIQREVNWFTEKFDYRNKDAPWGNSRDALPRSIQKISGYCRLK